MSFIKDLNWTDTCKSPIKKITNWTETCKSPINLDRTDG